MMMKSGVQIPLRAGLFSSYIFSSLTFHHKESRNVLNKIPQGSESLLNDLKVNKKYLAGLPGAKQA